MPPQSKPGTDRILPTLSAELHLTEQVQIVATRRNNSFRATQGVGSIGERFFRRVERIECFKCGSVIPSEQP